ncbi:hypothetical protein BRC86_04395 [Halobacteriales archaeon QS_3_64_16]|nr:MAG: hypothetical protein BRC86_04395 [Halobacteriales archaeon QS_3_64_16]
MNFATALLERLVPGRGEAETDDSTPTEQGSEPTSVPDVSESGLEAESERPTPRIAAEDVSEEDQVLRKLIAHGGRVSRSTLVSETDWSESELDEILKGMEADAQISTIRRRDPLVCRRGFEPAGAPLRFKND